MHEPFESKKTILGNEAVSMRVRVVWSRRSRRCPRKLRVEARRGVLCQLFVLDVHESGLVVV